MCKTGVNIIKYKIIKFTSKYKIKVKYKVLTVYILIF